MMYKNTPSQASSEAFLLWYVKNMKAYWEKNPPLLSGLPVLKSIVALPGFQEQTNKVAAIKDWVPVAKTYAAQGTELTPGPRAGRRRPTPSGLHPDDAGRW